jgi:hypothetical protein
MFDGVAVDGLPETTSLADGEPHVRPGGRGGGDLLTTHGECGVPRLPSFTERPL